MKALTILQPWASLIACGAKEIETRIWATKYRGPIAIHAAKKHFDTAPFFDRELQPFATAIGLPDIYSFNQLPLGCVIAIADLVDCMSIVYHPGTNVDIAKHIGIGAESITTYKRDPDFGKYIVPTKNEIAFGDWTPGRYAWILENVRPIEPLPARGFQRLWEWDGS